MAGRVEAVVFDVLETLLDVGAIAERLENVGQPTSVLEPFFLRFQRDAMALTLAGDQADFTAVARQALNTETRQAMTAQDIDHVLEGFAKVSAFPDALPALEKLSEAGVKVGCLTVGDPDNTRSFLAAAGLAPFVDEVITSSAVGTWKPAPAVYHYSAQCLGVELDRMALVAVHAWDCHGAKRVGALAGWCSRLEGEPGDVFEPADVRGDDLVEVIEGLLAL